jgi:hypothetical protein
MIVMRPIKGTRNLNQTRRNYSMGFLDITTEQVCVAEQQCSVLIPEMPGLDTGQDMTILRFFVDFLSPSRNIPAHHLKYATTTSFQILSYSPYTILPSTVFSLQYRQRPTINHNSNQS